MKRRSCTDGYAGGVLIISGAAVVTKDARAGLWCPLAEKRRGRFFSVGAKRLEKGRRYAAHIRGSMLARDSVACVEETAAAGAS